MAETGFKPRQPGARPATANQSTKLPPLCYIMRTMRCGLRADYPLGIIPGITILLEVKQFSFLLKAEEENELGIKEKFSIFLSHAIPPTPAKKRKKGKL